MSFTHLTPRIRVLTPEDSKLFPEALKLLNRAQGEDLFRPDYLDVMSKRSDAKIFAAFFEEQLIGIGIAQLITDLSYYLIFDPHLASELAQKKVGSFSTLAIHESFQGKGVGQKISRLRLEWLKSERCAAVLGTSWVSGLAHTSHRVFEKLGFRAIKKVNDFFRESSIRNPFYCPGCKAAPCECAAILYRLDLAL